MSKSKTVTDEMFLAAARALADVVTPEQIDQGQLYPEPKDLRKVAATVRVLFSAPLRLAVTLTPGPPQRAVANWLGLIEHIYHGNAV